MKGPGSSVSRAAQESGLCIEKCPDHQVRHVDLPGLLLDIGAVQSVTLDANNGENVLVSILEWPMYAKNPIGIV